MVIAETGGKGEIGPEKPPEGGNPLGGRDTGSLHGADPAPQGTGLPDAGKTLAVFQGVVSVSTAPRVDVGIHPALETRPTVVHGDVLQQRVRTVAGDATQSSDGQSDEQRVIETRNSDKDVEKQKDRV